MTKYRVNKDCFCEHYLHELTKYYRPGLKEKKLEYGTIVDHVKTWSNFYGTYHRVQYKGETYDIDPKNLDEIKNHG